MADQDAPERRTVTIAEAKAGIQLTARRVVLVIHDEDQPLPANADGAAAENDGGAAAAAAPAADAETFALEVHLVDSNDQPIADMAFDLALPDGQKVSGRSEADGRIAASSGAAGSARLELFPGRSGTGPGTDTGLARLRVTVVDEGGPLENASVRLSGPAQRTATTDASGSALFAELPAGEYEIAGELPGFVAGSDKASLEEGDASVSVLTLAPARPAVDPAVKRFVGRIPGQDDESANVHVDAGSAVELAWEVENASNVRIASLADDADEPTTVTKPAGDGGRGTHLVEPATSSTFLLFALAADDDTVRAPQGGPPAHLVRTSQSPPVTAQVTPALRFLSFLPHFTGTDAAHAVALTPASMNPGFQAGSPGAGLRGCVEALLRAKPGYVRSTGLQFAVADLTKDPAKPEIAGSKIGEHWESASSGKVAIMYAAFQLRFDLNALAAKNPQVQKIEDLFALVRGEWGKTQTRVDPPSALAVAAGNSVKLELAGKLILRDGKPIEGPAGFSAPKLEKIFTASKGPSGALQVDFIRHPQRQTSAAIWKKVIPIGDSGSIADLTFLERVCSMVDASHNEATTSVEQDLGFLFMASAFWQSGLYDPAAGGGFWMGRLFPKGNVWQPAPVPTPTPRTPDKAEIRASLSARAGVALMTMLEQGKLVDPASCKEMKEMLDRTKIYGAGPASAKPDTVDRSPAGDALKGKGIKADELYSKIGIGGRNNIWDIALVKRTVGGKQLRYAIACLDCVLGASDSGDGLLTQIVVDLDDCVRKTNP